MFRYFIAVILFVFSAFTVSAETITAEGFGDSPDSARSAALAELSFTIYSNVSASLSYASDTDFNSANQKLAKQTDITTELPIIGAEVSITKISDGYNAKAVLKDSSAPIYKSKLDEVLRQIENTYADYQKENNRAKAYGYVSSLIVYLDNYEKLNSVYSILTGASYAAKPPVAKEEMLKALSSLSDVFDDLKLCARVMAKELNSKTAYLYYPMAENSDEVTEFSSVLHGMLSAEMSPSKEILTSDRFVNTQYSVSKDGIFITSYLTDKNGKTLVVSNKRLLPAAYKNLEINPVSISFEKLLKQGLSVSSDFKARVTTKNGKRAVLYKNGDTLELFVKVNKPSYFYIVGHVMKEKEKYSYLVDLFETEGNRRFIRYVDGDEINRWISLGQFEVVSPFGTEVFQMIASVEDPMDKLPPVTHDAANNQYIISDNPEKSVAILRAIKRKESKAQEQAEDVLIFSSTHR